ncbi:mitochondrial glycoprotein [Mycena galopus ATCC 62051]|nr:mitochondrial glycoprotein [Mycena galopus ATCC 62051]
MSAARTFRQLATASGRLSSRQLCSSSLVRLPLVARTASHIPAASRAFSVSARSLKAGSSDVLLTQKLAEELKYEIEEAPAGEPEFLTVFKEQGIWKIQDTPGSQEVVFTRQFGNESIRLTFSVADLQNQEPPEEFDEEGEEGEKPQEDLPSEIMRVVVSITKATVPGALEIDMTLQSGQFMIESVTHYADAKLGQDVSVESDWKRRGLYVGPEFTTLDVGVQEQFEKFLDERDIGESLAFFIPDFAGYKEQREYVNWLESVKNFVDA